MEPFHQLSQGFQQFPIFYDHFDDFELPYTVEGRGDGPEVH
jgi:hypothetical protein